jgi:hypothetical protein
MIHITRHTYHQDIPTSLQEALMITFYRPKPFKDDARCEPPMLVKREEETHLTFQFFNPLLACIVCMQPEAEMMA